MNKTNNLKNTFSSVINDYDCARPRYPIALYDAIKQFSNISEHDSILEIGAGTGQATELFVSENYMQDLLEVSEEQVAFLKDKYISRSNITVQKGYFEEYETTTKYDLIYSATAFHWIDCEVGYPKAWNLLKEGGTLAVFWQMSSVTYRNEGIFVHLNEIQKRYLPDHSLGFTKDGIEEVKQNRIRQIQSGGYFEKPEYYEFEWIDTYDADRYAALINTYSSTQIMDSKLREQYLNEIRECIVLNNDGIVKLPQLVCLYMVHK